MKRGKKFLVDNLSKLVEGDKLWVCYAKDNWEMNIDDIPSDKLRINEVFTVQSIDNEEVSLIDSEEAPIEIYLKDIIPETNLEDTGRGYTHLFFVESDEEENGN